MSDEQHSILHGIQTQPPCDVAWESMNGNNRNRFCQTCRLHVYRIDGCSESEVEELIAPDGASGRTQLFMRKDGTVTTVPCAEARFKKTVGDYGLVIAIVGFMVVGVIVIAMGFIHSMQTATYHEPSFSEVVSQLNALNRYAETQPQKP